MWATKKTLFVLAKITIATHIELVDNIIEVTCLFDNMGIIFFMDDYGWTHLGINKTR